MEEKQGNKDFFLYFEHPNLDWPEPGREGFLQYRSRLWNSINQRLTSKLLDALLTESYFRFNHFWTGRRILLALFLDTLSQKLFRGWTN